MKIRTCLLISFALGILLCSSSVRAIEGEASPEALQVMVGKSIVVNSQETLKRVSVTDPNIASAMIVSPNQVLIHGQTPGSVTLMLWDDKEHSRSYNLQVDADISNLRQAMKDVFPDEQIAISQSGAAVVLAGNVSSKPVAERAAALAQTQTKNVINMLQTSDVREAVSLQVRFAEVDRQAIAQYGFNIFSTGGANTIGATTTQQFGGLEGNVGGVPRDATRGRDPQTPDLAAGGIGNKLGGTPAVIGLTDLLNIFLFRPDLNLGAAIKALQQRNLLQILAEPNLLAMNGVESSFLAGGEFPFPVLQGGGSFQAVTIQFKEFGVRLRFRPLIQNDGTIRLKVAPEVSALDFSNSLTISGFLIPALSTRRAETEVELRDGQSFAIAGLMDSRLAEAASKIPGLGHVPIIGKLFQSSSKNRNKTELLVVITPRLVRPLEPGQVPQGPAFPEPFLDDRKFDGKSSSSGEQQNSTVQSAGASPTVGDSPSGDGSQPANDSHSGPPKKKDKPPSAGRVGSPFGNRRDN